MPPPQSLGEAEGSFGHFHHDQAYGLDSRDLLTTGQAVFNVEGNGLAQVGEGFFVGIALDVAALQFGAPSPVAVGVVSQDGREVVLHRCLQVTACGRGKHTLRIVEVKSASTLYEYWSFFEVTEVLRQLVGRPKKAWSVSGDDVRLTLEGCLNVQFDRDVELSYNRTYSMNQGVSRSYSVPLRPDISLRLGDRLHLFDAKFRIEKWEMPDSDTIRAEEEAEERPLGQRSYFKTSDIHKMHAYMDAIRLKEATPENRLGSVSGE